MKNLTQITLTALMAFFVLQGCEKARLQDINSGSKLKVSKTQIAVGEVDSLYLTEVTAEDSIIWTVSPDANEHIGYKANEAVITFSAPGTYVVTAKKAGGIPASATITVSAGNNSGYHEDPQNTNTNVITANDTTTFEPIVGDIKVHFSAGYATSDFNSYTANGDIGVTTTCPTGFAQYTATVDASQNYSLDVVNIREHINCANPASVGKENWVSQVFPNKLISLGTHQLKITVNGKTYTGSFTVTDESVTITWPYTSGVIMESQLYYKYR